MEFELRGLPDFKDETLLAELRRVAKLCSPGQPLKRKDFDKHAKASSNVIARRFGGWSLALERAGLQDRYSGRVVSSKMRASKSKKMSNTDLIVELKRVAHILGVEVLTRHDFAKNSEIGSKAIKSRFGSWEKALNAAGLRLSDVSKRYEVSDYFENLLNIWTHYGHQPTYGEMDTLPSKIGARAYEHRWGTWRKALAAFVDYANSSSKIEPNDENSTTSRPEPLPAMALPNLTPEAQRKIPLGLRFQVFKRDRYKCLVCGKSPATSLTCELHVDHIQPFSGGGKTSLENLQTLCSDCNLGKGDRPF